MSGPGHHVPAAPLPSPSVSPWHVIRYGTSSEVHDLLQRGQDRASTAFRADPASGAPLAFAALQRADVLVLHLCETAGLSWQGEDHQGNNAWHWAASRQDMVPWLMERPQLLGKAGLQRRTLDAFNTHRHTPLMIACGLTAVGGDNHEENALPLLNAGANARAMTPTGDTLLHLMALPDLTRALVAAGAPVNGVSRDGEPALFRAVSMGLAEVVDALLDLGANPDASFHGVSPLRRALSGREPEIADRLMQAGANPWAVGPDGQRAWDVAVAWPELQVRWEQRHLRSTLDASTPSPMGPTDRSRPRL